MAKRHFETNSKAAMREGGGMIQDARNKPCNLPTEVMDKEWGPGSYGMNDNIEDLYMGVKKQMREDAKDLSRELSPGKY